MVPGLAFALDPSGIQVQTCKRETQETLPPAASTPEISEIQVQTSK